MKYFLAILATLLMIWSLLDKDNASYKIYIQVVAVALFFYVMMKLMDKTPSKNTESENTENIKKDDEGVE